MITGYSVVFVPTNNFEESKRWYEKNLGFEWDQFIMKVPNGAPLFFVESSVNWNFKDVNGNECAILSFRVEDADKLHSILSNNNEIIEDKVRINGIGKEFWFVDSSGNKLLATQQM
jgi:predicted enzyme related to lactoylglutathione lyase